MHAVAAPLEHREFTRNAVADNPAMAVPLAAAVPAYALAKTAGVLPIAPNTTPASLDQVFAGFEGIAQGLRKRLLRQD